MCSYLTVYVYMREYFLMSVLLLIALSGLGVTVCCTCMFRDNESEDESDFLKGIRRKGEIESTSARRKSPIRY